jgi:hypothetical protein
MEWMKDGMNEGLNEWRMEWMKDGMNEGWNEWRMEWMKDGMNDEWHGKKKGKKKKYKNLKIITFWFLKWFWYPFGMPFVFCMIKFVWKKKKVNQN